MSIRRALLASLLCTALTIEVMAAEPGNIFGIKFPQSIEEMFEVAHEDPEAGMTFKKGYSSFFFQNIRHYDDNLGLGYGLNYASVTDINVSVYVYDLGLENIPDGVDSKAIADELMDASQAIVDSGQYAKIEEHADVAPLSPHFAQLFHTLSTNDGRSRNSYTFLRGQNGFFIKVRASGPAKPIEHNIGAFLESLAEDLGIEGESFLNE